MTNMTSGLSKAWEDFSDSVDRIFKEASKEIEETLSESHGVTTFTVTVSGGWARCKVAWQILLSGKLKIRRKAGYKHDAN